MNNPSCVTLMDSILKYVQSDQFQPRHSLEAAELMRLVTPQANITNTLVDPGFEKSGHWVTEGGQHEVDSSAAHGGKKSLKLMITESDLAQNKNYASGMSARRISFGKNPRYLKLAAWYKTESASQQGGPTLAAAISLPRRIHPQRIVFSLHGCPHPRLAICGKDYQSDRPNRLTLM